MLRVSPANRAGNSPGTKSHCFKLGPTLTKELTFSSNIGRHDLDTKSKQIQQWIEKKYKVQITIKKAKNTEEPENKTVSKNRSNCFLFSDLKVQL